MANTKGLGKGLSALLGDDVIAAKDERASSLLLPISQVESCSTQPRKSFDAEALSDLADSIRVHGIIQPLTVRKLQSGYYQIIAGERRWRAARMAGPISRNIGVIDMQTSHTTASAAVTTSLARRIVAASWKPVLFAVLMWLSAAAGEIPIPGTPVPITLQTFVVMLAGLMLPWRQAGAAVATYLAAGAVGLPVFAGGTSTLALVGPSAGFLFGFLPGVVVIALLRGKSDTSSFAAAARTAGRYLLAALVGGIVVVYAFGFVIQSALTGAPLAAVALVSMSFVVGDAIKAVVASLAAAGLSKLGR